VLREIIKRFFDTEGHRSREKHKKSYFQTVSSLSARFTNIVCSCVKYIF